MGALGPRITEEARELKLKQKDLPYEDRDHALFVAFAPYKNPRYAFSVVIEHGGTGSSAAAPLAKKVIKKVCLLYTSPSPRDRG